MPTVVLPGTVAHTDKSPCENAPRKNDQQQRVNSTPKRALQDAMSNTCPHLEPLERAVEAAGISFEKGAFDLYGPDWGIWYYANCTFDEPSLRSRLSIPEFINFVE